MKALVRIASLGEEQAGSFFVGEVISGVLMPGMEALTTVGVIEVRSILAVDDLSQKKKRALPTQRVAIVPTRNISPEELKTLEAEVLEFSDQKLISLKKGIFLSPEPS